MSLCPGNNLSASSPHHGLIAAIDSNNLNIYNGASLEIIRSVRLEASIAATCRKIRFYRASDRLHWQSNSTAEHPTPPPPPRILLANDTDVHIYDAFDARYHASISAACLPPSRIAHVGFVTANEVIVFADFNVKATIYDLRTGLGTEVRDPKSQRGSAGYSIRPRTSHLAMLARVGVKDMVLILEPGKREVEASFALESLDAQSIRWSGDGRWLAIWDTPGMGGVVWIYTADGQLFRTWNYGKEVQDNLSLGIRMCEWSAKGDWLFAGTGDGKIVGLGGRNFLPRLTLSHPTTSISVSDDAHIYQEEILSSPAYTRNYALIPSPVVPPTLPTPNTKATTTTTTPPPLFGTTLLSPSPSGAFLASVSAATPSTLWIRSLTPEPRTHTILIHHCTVKKLEWHPQRTDLLLIQCTAVSLTESGEKSRTGSGQHTGSGEGLGRRRQHWAYVWGAELSKPVVVSLVAPPPPPAGAGAESKTWPAQISSSSSSSSTSSATSMPTVSWVSDSTTSSSAPPNILVSTQHHGFFIKSPWSSAEDRASFSGPKASQPPPITGEGPEDAFDEGFSLDLSPVRLSGELRLGNGGTGRDENDDTFAFRKQQPYGGAGGGGGAVRAW